jgi:hypothetical protein
MCRVLQILPILAMLACVGCGSGDQIRRAIIEGEVTYDGQPIANGQIRFYPAGDTPGGVASAPIVAGKYVVENKGGVPLGTHRVEVLGYRAPPGAFNPDSAPEQFLPAKYNRTTELAVEIVDSSDQHFHLKP